MKMSINDCNSHCYWLFDENKKENTYSMAKAQKASAQSIMDSLLAHDAICRAPYQIQDYNVYFPFGTYTGCVSECVCSLYVLTEILNWIQYLFIWTIVTIMN